MLSYSARGRTKVPSSFSNRCPRNAIRSKHQPTFWSRCIFVNPMYPNSNRSRCASEAISLCHSLLSSPVSTRAASWLCCPVLLSIFAARRPSFLTQAKDLRWRRGGGRGSGRGTLAPAGLLLRVLVAWRAAVLLAEVPPALGHLPTVSFLAF